MVHGAEEVREHERRLRFYAGIGKAPPLTETELQLQLRKVRALAVPLRCVS